MKKQFYNKPQMKTIDVEAETILAGSGDGARLQNYEGEEWSDD